MNDRNIITGHVNTSKDFLDRSKNYLACGDLHQASEKGWGAAVHMVKAIAEVRGWDYARHDQFDVILSNAREFYRDPKIRVLGQSAHALHRNFYQHPDFLNANDIKEDIAAVESFVGILEPLTLA